MEYLEVTNVGRTHIVPIGGSIHEAIERPVRWTQILRWHFPGAIAGTWFVSLLVLAGAILASVPVAVALTVLHLGVNEVLGVRQWTAVLAYPSLCVFVPLLLYTFGRSDVRLGRPTIPLAREIRRDGC